MNKEKRFFVSISFIVKAEDKDIAWDRAVELLSEPQILEERMAVVQYIEY